MPGEQSCLSLVWAVLDLLITHETNGIRFNHLDRQRLKRIRYWRQVKDRPLKIEEFGSHYHEVDLLLEELAVGVSTEGCTAIDQRVEQVTDEVALLARVIRGKYRHPEFLAHDVKHRLQVDHL